MKPRMALFLGIWLGVLAAVSATDVALIRRQLPAGMDAARQREVDRFLQMTRERLRSLGLSVDTLGDRDLTAGALTPYRLVLLPYNPGCPETAVAALSAYVSAGGRLGLFYTSEAALLRLVGIAEAAYVGGSELSRLGGIGFIPGALEGAPEFLGQRSWNINQPVPVPGSGTRVVASWKTADGSDTGRPAVTVHPAGFFMGHVYLDEDTDAGSRFFLSVLGHYFPDVWERAVQRRLDSLGVFTGIADLEALARSFGEDAPVAAQEALSTAQRTSAEAAATLAKGEFAAAYDLAETAAAAARRAYLLSRRSRRGELRGAWIHSAYGIGSWGWERTIRELSDHGFNAIFVNMLWGAVADYPSEVLPVHPDVAEKGDQIALCLEACRKYGVELHVWKVNWNMGHRTPAAIRAQFQEQGRTQANLQGVQNMYLAPHIEENFRLEQDAMLEVVRNYDVDGIHFDYIRYPGAESDFSAAARLAFERWHGAAVPDWPADCREGGALRGPYNQWRRGNITRLVRAVYGEAHRIRPEIQVSAAVFGGWDSSPDTIAQATEEWIDNGWLDFVCPMNYTNSAEALERLLQRQISAVKGRIPLYCGLGSWRHDGPSQTAGQIEITRRLGADGFICFSHNPRFVDAFLPGLSLGVTKEPAGVLPHHSLPLGFTLSRGPKKLDGAFRVGQRVSLDIDLPGRTRDLQVAVSLARDGYECSSETRLDTRRGRRRIRGTFRPQVPGMYRVEVRGERPATEAGELAAPIMARSPLIEVLSEDAAAERELRNSPPRFSKPGIRVAVWQHSGYGSGPILAALERADGVSAAPLYNLDPESLAVCDVVVLTQPRAKIALFKDAAVMDQVGDYLRAGGGVLVTHALVGIRGFVNLAPDLTLAGDRVAGSTWRACGEHVLSRGIPAGVHESTFSDRISVTPAGNAVAVAETPEGVPLVVAATPGRGRYLACGLGLGIGRNDRDADLTAPEEVFLLHAVRWLGRKD